MMYWIYWILRVYNTTRRFGHLGSKGGEGHLASTVVPLDFQYSFGTVCFDYSDNEELSCTPHDSPVVPVTEHLPPA